MATPTYELIETTTLTSAASSVSFTSITQDYRDLVLVVNCGQTGGNAVVTRINSDSTDHYETVAMYGGGTFFASANRTDTFIIGGVASYPPSDIGYLLVQQFMDYSATDKHKTVLSRANSPDIPGVDAVATRWPDTSAITNIEVSIGSSFVSGSTFSLYGIA